MNGLNIMICCRAFSESKTNVHKETRTGRTSVIFDGTGPCIQWLPLMSVPEKNIVQGKISAKK